MIIINIEASTTSNGLVDFSNSEAEGYFNMEGRWISAYIENSCGEINKGSSYYSADANNYAQYTPFNLEPGWYDISFWNIKYRSDQIPVKMKGVVYSDGVLTENIPLDISTSAIDRKGAWTKVGTYYFAGTGNEYFRLVATGGAFARPSDVKFELNTKLTARKPITAIVKTNHGNCAFVHFHDRAVIHTKNEKFYAEPGTCIIHNNYETFRFEGADGPLRYDRMEFSESLNELMEKTGLKYNTPYCTGNIHTVIEMVAKIKFELSRNDLFKKEITDLLVTELFFRISKEHILKSFPTFTETIRTALTTVRNEMLMSYNNKWTVEQMAKKACMSTPYFYMLYKSMFGISPKKDLQQIRIDNAKLLLSQKNHSIKEIAMLIGYENEYYFIRKFKEVTGTTPGKFKQKVLDK